MKLLEMKNRLALETARLIFQNNIDVIFIGGTALNAFYLDYRYSEDLDLGYGKENRKPDIEALLEKNGYLVERTDFDFRDVISLEGVSIKMDVIEYKKKYTGFEERSIGDTKVRTLTMGEFAIGKMISFFTREDLAGMARDGYDLFSIEKEYGMILDLARKEKGTVRRNIVSLGFNVERFGRETEKVESAVVPYLRKPVDAREVLGFLKNLRGALG